jgi:asparagine synthase (glutamine-hydrolysing)
MCGLAGFFSSERYFTRQNLEDMTQALEHRGPDSFGYFEGKSVGMGNRRLSIVDLSERASQPMHSANGRYVMVYNGMVYNYSEIGASLRQTQDTHFVTSSDTEVVLEAFVKYGPDFVHMLNGMYAIAIYDKLRDELHIFRDRLGIKPLYYYWDGKNFAFASELKALRAVPQIPKTLNKGVIRDFLHFGYIPTPFSIYERIYKMNSGTRLKISKAGLEEFKYWDVVSCLQPQAVTDEEEALVKLSDLLISSIQYQLKSDVPFGIFLSGGVDSSIIASKVAGLSNVKPNTFTIGFSDNIFNETAYARKVADTLGTKHHEFIVSVNDVVNLIDPVFDVFDEPFADSSAVPTLLVSKLAKQYVTVALSGEGGDELFLGYGSYRWASRLDSAFYRMFRQPMAFVLSKMSSRYQRVAELLDYSPGSNLQSHIFSQEQYWFSERELDSLCRPAYRTSELHIENMPVNFLELYRHRLKSPKDITLRKLNAMEEQALFDLQFYLQDDLLTKTDRCGMHYSLEARVPFLDHRIVEYALNLSPSLKFRNGTPKYILNRILYKYMPKDFFNRPKKGFDIPLAKWLRKELKSLITDNLNEGVIKKYDVVDGAQVNELLARFDNGADYLFNRIWLLIVLHKWLRKFEP